jgi:hypothetical protein
MSYGNLTRLVGERYEKRIAHNTTATAYLNHVSISYHGNQIARVYEDGEIFLTTAGWATQTTVARLNAILRDNLAGTPYRVAIRDFAVCLIDATEPRARHYFREVSLSPAGEILTREKVSA